MTRVATIVAAGAALFAVAGCGKEDQAAGASGGSGAPGDGAAGAGGAAGAAPTKAPWTLYGADLEATRSSPDTTISPKNVAKLERKWDRFLKRCTSTPAVQDGVVYYADWYGNAYASRARDGKELWSKKISTFAIDSSPLLMDGKVYFGDGGGDLSALDPKTGETLCKRSEEHTSELQSQR